MHVRKVYAPEQLRCVVERLVLLDGRGVAQRKDGAAAALHHQMVVRLQRVHVLLWRQAGPFDAQP